MSSSRPQTRAQATGAAPSRRRSTSAKTTGGGSRKTKWAKIVGLTVLGGLLLLLIAFFVAYATIKTPQPNDLASAQASIIYYSDGKTEIDRISQVNRESVALSKVPKFVQEAHLAAEDRNFYQNSGISPSGIARAVWVALRGGSTQGGSTITQQYVKNYFLSQDQTLTRKGKEIIISIKIAKQESKSTILENYLNTIYYGRGAYGVETASRAYFGKDVSQLNVSQGALLASVIRGPSFYDPRLGPQQKANAEARWKYVIDGMVKEGWITSTQAAQAKFPTTIPRSTQKATSGPNGFITDAVKRELKSKLKLTDADIDRGGYRIVTTIDKRAQQAAIDTIKSDMPKGPGTETLRVGLTSIKPGDGAVVAMYGGADYLKNQFNTATQAQMQAGSTFKAFTLIAALQQDISTKTRFKGFSPQYFPQYADSNGTTDAQRRGRVANFSNEQFGDIDLRTATGHSVNTVYAQLNIKVGPDKTKAAAVAAGLPEKAQNATYSNVFGTSHEHVMDMANAYATIAAQGQRVSPYFIKSVKGGPGGLDYTAKPAPKSIFDKKVMADTIDALQQPVKIGTATYAQNLGRPAAGKTGTTTDNKAAWFNGFVPQLETAVGIYSSGKGGAELSMNHVPGVGELTGGTIPVRIWTDYMKLALQGQKVIDFPARAGVGDDKVVIPTITTTSTTTTSTTTTTTTTTTTAPPTTTTTTTKTHGPVPTPTGPPTTGTITILGKPQNSTTTQ
ncbi:transglycosylase domain-containing protein [Nostocoides sp. HKS02]|uniref:transglycosylase domain-containing protein n=1 Tax=Nostocoides sp. HKS02 TaxID=1813880 RepID=UPI0012B4F2E0|nr:transglycosylase domain-containing protein [Tetrasphaera sp. HKS02]QGN58661.1 penicillin-binding protein [Tetrasphaera sp. HKS02]